MLAFDSYPRSVFNTAPIRRSPLGSRDTNTCNNWATGAFVPSPPAAATSFFTRMSHVSNENEQSEHHKRRIAQPRKREGKFAPLLRKKDDRELRRNAYLSNARRAGDDKLFAARLDQNLRREFFEEQQELQARQEAEEAATRPLVEEEEETDLSYDIVDEDNATMLEPPSDDDDAYQQYLWSQDQMNMSRPAEPIHNREHAGLAAPRMSDYWSDDDDFEQFLLEAAMEFENGPEMDATAGNTISTDTDMTS